MSALARFLGTFFYLGYVPKGPGTAGSLGALAIAWVLHAYLGHFRRVHRALRRCC